MVEEVKVLKAVYGLVKGDPSPVHLPVSPVVMSQMADLPLEKVQKCCHVLENHGCLTSSKGISEPIYYITKMGVDQALNPTLPFYIYSSSSAPHARRKA